MDAMDIDRLRAELGMAEFARRLAAEPTLRAAWEARKAARADDPATTSSVHGLPPSVWNVSPTGRDHPLVRVPVGRRHVIRAVGDLVVVLRHWSDAGGRICFGAKCPLCPSERRREGYIDAIAARTLRDQTTELYRCVAAIPEAAIDALDGFDGMPMRGMKLMLYRKGERARTTVEILEESAAVELPPAIDVTLPLQRVWNLPAWPTADEEEKPATLPFRRKQA